MKRVFRHIISIAGFLSAVGVVPSWEPMKSVFAQELKDELDALEDLPPDDLSSVSPPSAAEAVKTPAVPTPPTTSNAKEDPIDDLPIAEGESVAPSVPPAESATADLPVESAPPVDDALEGVGGGGEGLEKELQALDPRTEPSVNPPVAALTGVDAEPVGKVTHLDFRQLPDRVRLTVKGTRVMDFERELRSKRKQIILQLPNATLSRNVLKRALDTGEFDGPVALVQAFEARAGGRPSVKVLFQLRRFVDPTVLKSGNDLVVDFPIVTDSTIYKSRGPKDIHIPETFLSLNSKMPAEGKKMSLAVKDAELQDVLNLISRASGKNFILSGGTSAKVSLNVRRVPWDEVLRVILVNAKLGYQKVGDVYRVAPIAELRKEIDESAESVQKAENLTPLETRLYSLSYAKAQDVDTSIKDFKTARGKSSVDKRTNTLVVTDIPETLERIARYIKFVDRQTAQVLIEGRVVEASKDLTNVLNVNWGLSVTGGALAGTRLNVGSNEGLVNRGMYSGRLGGWGAVSTLLAAQETENNIRTIASPRVLVLDNQDAQILQGDSFPVQIPGTATTVGGVQYVDATLSLKVTPQVTSDAHVLMKIDFKRDTVANAEAARVAKRQANTQVLVESGKTVVIGGIYISDSNETTRGLPWFRNIPVIGAIFRNNMTSQEVTKELLMFISPKIMNPEKAFLVNAGVESENESEGLRPVTSRASESVPDDLF